VSGWWGTGGIPRRSQGAPAMPSSGYEKLPAYGQIYPGPMERGLLNQ